MTEREPPHCPTCYCGRQNDLVKKAEELAAENAGLKEKIAQTQDRYAAAYLALNDKCRRLRYALRLAYVAMKDGRERLFNCAVRSGSDPEYADLACTKLDEAIKAAEGLVT